MPHRRLSRREFLGMTGGALALGGCRSRHAPLLAVPGRPVAEPAAAADLASLRPLLAEIVAGLEQSVPYASVTVLRQRSTLFEVDDGAERVDERFPSAGAVLSVFNGGFLEESATSDLSPEGLRRAASELATRVTRAPLRFTVDPGTGGERTFRTACRLDPLTISLGERFERTRTLHRRLRAMGSGLASVSVSLIEQVHDELFVNRAKSFLQQVVRVRARFECVASGGGRSVSNTLSPGGTGGLEVADVTDAELEGLVRETRVLLGSSPVEAGPRTLVLAPEIAGTLAHESFGHGVELDMFVQGRAKAAEYVGKRVGSELVSISDDPSLAGGYGSYFFDHEGELAGPTRIVEDGVFRRGLTDLLSASRLGVARTANGRRQDYRRKTYARMSNTFFARGSEPREELIAGVRDGLYLRKLSHGMEDPKGWGIQVVAHLGEEIRDGKLTGKLMSPVGITGYVPDVLATVDGVASDFATDTGTCGKGNKEFLPVGAGGPHVRLRARVA